MPESVNEFLAGLNAVITDFFVNCFNLYCSVNNFDQKPAQKREDPVSHIALTRVLYFVIL